MIRDTWVQGQYFSQIAAKPDVRHMKEAIWMHPCPAEHHEWVQTPDELSRGQGSGPGKNCSARPEMSKTHLLFEVTQV